MPGYGIRANDKIIVSRLLPVKFLVRKVAFESTAGFLKDRTVNFSVL